MRSIANNIMSKYKEYKESSVTFEYVYLNSITIWLFVLNRNPTLDRLVSWSLDIEPTCLFCGVLTESRNHLFSECAYTSLI